MTLEVRAFALDDSNMASPRLTFPTCNRMAGLLTLMVALAGPTAIHADGPFRFSGDTMGTTYLIQGEMPGHIRSSEEVHARIRQRLDFINHTMSTYLDDSEVSRFNQAAANEWFDVSLQTAKLVETAQQISRDTNGAFDITVGPLVALWNFGPAASPSPDIPNEDVIRETLERVGHDKLDVRLAPPSLRKRVAGVEIDLSAIAKGYAVDESASILTAFGVASFMVEIGGEIRLSGANAQGLPWSIGIESPNPQSREVELTLTPREAAIASSGDYRNFFEKNGKLYSHTIDPRSGSPVDHGLAAVTVTSKNCAVADAVATALMVLGPTEGFAWAEQHRVGAVFLARTGESVSRRTTSHLKVVPPKPTTSFPRLFVAAAIVFGLAVLAMAVGVIFSNRRIRGSCGGLAGLQDANGNAVCDACTDPSPTCDGTRNGAAKTNDSSIS